MKEADEDPITNEEIEEWLFAIEQVAATERDLGFATRLVLTNLLKRLATRGVFDSRQLILDLQQGLDSLDIEENERLGSHIYLQELEQKLPELSQRPPGESQIH